MKLFKRTLGILMAVVIAASVALIPATASAAKVKTAKQTISVYETAAFDVFYTKYHKFKLSITNNSKKYLKASINYDAGDSEFGQYFALIVTGLKKTPKKDAPVVTVYYKNKDGKKVTIAKAKVTVKGTKPKAQNFKNLTLNPGTLAPSQEIVGNYYDVEERISDKSVVKTDYNSPYTTTDIYRGEYSDCGYVKALKKGTATISYWLKNYNVKLGEYKVTVKDVKTTINKNYETVELKYFDGKLNKLYDRNQFYTALVLENYHKDAVYTSKIEDESVLSAKTVKKGKVSPNTNELLSAKKTGETKVKIYEQKKGSSKKTKVGTVNVKVEPATMADIVEAGDRDHSVAGIYFMCIEKDETVDGFESVRLTWLENFNESDYTIKLTTDDTKVFNIDENGKVTRLSNAYARITIEVTFTDGSVFTTENYPEFDPSANVAYDD